MTRRPDIAVPRSFHERLDTFVGGRPELPLDDQLQTMHQFWRLVGLPMPAPNSVQRNSMETHIKTRGRGRIVPTPFLAPKPRTLLANRAMRLIPKGANVGAGVQLPNAQVNAYAAMTEAPGSDLAGQYRLGYRFPENKKFYDRKGFIGAMVATDQAVYDQKTTLTWVFPHIDISSPRQYSNDQQRSKYTHKSTEILLSRLEPAVTPDVLLMVEILNMINGRRPSGNEITFGNECMFHLGKRAVTSVVGIERRPHAPALGLVTRSLDLAEPSFGVRVAMNGLRPRS